MRRNFSSSSIGLLFGCAAAMVAAINVSFAQDGTDAGASASPAPVSELDALSRINDDPFAGIIDQTKREPVSVTLRALDKITARFIDIEVKMHEIAKFGSLELQPRFCDTRPPEEFPETSVFVEIFDTESNAGRSNLKVQEEIVLVDEIPTQDIGTMSVEGTGAVEPSLNRPAPIVAQGPKATGHNIFRGWMFASSPALNSLEHAVYDVWVIDCNTRTVLN